MPKHVNHDLRRRELAQAAVRLIAREGLEGATTRALADESGWTTGVLKHYFAGKDDVLRHALRELEMVNRERLDATDHRHRSGYEALHRAVESMLDEDAAHTRVWVAFLGRAATDPAVAAELQRGSKAWQRRWAGLVRRGQADGSIRLDADARAVAVELWALVGGLRIAELFEGGARRHRAGALTLLAGLRPIPVTASRR